MSTTEIVKTELATFSAKELMTTLKMFNGIIDKNSKRGSKSLVDSIKIIFSGHYVTFVGYAADMSACLEIDVAVDYRVEYADIVVSYFTLSRIISTFKTGNIVLSIGNDVLYVSNGIGIPLTVERSFESEDSPSILDSAEDCCNLPAMTFPGVDLAKALSLTAPLVANGDTRYALNHVYFGVRPGGGVEMCGSDTHRLGLYEFPDIDATPLIERNERMENARYYDSSKAKQDPMPDLPAIGGKALSFLKAFAGKEEKLSIGFTDKWVVAHSGNWTTSDAVEWTLYGRLHEGTFPNYHDVIPDYSCQPGKTSFDRKALVKAIKASLPLTVDHNRITLRKADSGEIAATLEVWDKETLRFSIDVPAASRKLPYIEFNGKFLLECVSSGKSNVVELAFGGESVDPIVIRDGEFTHVLMPLNSYSNDEKAEAENKAWQEAYDESLKLDNQGIDHLSTADVPVDVEIRPPSFKSVVKRALVDSEYKRNLLKALGL